MFVCFSVAVSYLSCMLPIGLSSVSCFPAVLCFICVYSACWLRCIYCSCLLALYVSFVSWLPGIVFLYASCVPGVQLFISSWLSLVPAAGASCVWFWQPTLRVCHVVEDFLLLVFFQMSSLWLLFLFHTVLSVCCWFSCVTSLPFSYFFCLAAICVCIWSCVPAVCVPVVHVYLLLVLPHLSCLPAADWFIWLKSGLCSSFSSFSCKCVCCVVIHVLCACCWLFMHIMSGSLWVLHNLLVCLLLICSYVSCLVGVVLSHVSFMPVVGFSTCSCLPADGPFLSDMSACF